MSKQMLSSEIDPDSPKKLGLQIVYITALAYHHSSTDLGANTSHSLASKGSG